MSSKFLNLTVLSAMILIARAEDGKGSAFYKRFMTKQATAPSTAGATGGKDKQSYVFQPPNMLGRWPVGRGYGFGYAGLGNIHPVPVTGVKALSVAYDPVSGVPYVCDPTKKADAPAEGAQPAAAGGDQPAAPAAGGAEPAAPSTGKRSDVSKDVDKKDEIKVKIPDYPPCPDPKKSFPWSCILADKASKREKCASAKKAVEDASKRYWPALGGLYPPYLGSYGAVGSYSVPVPLGVPVGLPYGYGGYYGY